MGCSYAGVLGKEVLLVDKDDDYPEKKRSGILQAHAYSITGIYEIDMKPEEI